MPRKSQGFKEFHTEHLKCRALTHAWDPIRTTLIRIEGRPVFETLLECHRCGTIKTDRVYVSGGDRVKRPVYGNYPDWYLIEDLKSWGGRSEFNRNARVELYRRFLKKGK